MVIHSLHIYCIITLFVHKKHYIVQGFAQNNLYSYVIRTVIHTLKINCTI